MKPYFRYLVACLFVLILVANAWGQWSSDPSTNLPLADNNNGSDQVQPKVKPLPNRQWYVSWFDADPSTPPPVGYDVFYQHLSPSGVQLLKHDGRMVADLGLSSTEDNGLDIDTSGNAIIAFLDDREGSNPQVTAARMSPEGKALWGRLGVQLTKGSASHNNPKITGTTDGGIVVAWSDNQNVVVQKLDASGQPQWGKGVVFSESGYSYTMADLHAADNGSVIVSWARGQGFGSNQQLEANKISSTGSKLWGKSNVMIFDDGSLQFGEFPYFVPDGSGGAVFSWYTNSPTLQVFAQHILANGKEAFPHNGVSGSTNGQNVRVSPSASYRAATGEVFLAWTEEDGNQVLNGVYAQKFDSKGNRKWGQTGLVIVPLGSDQQIWVETVQVAAGILTYWVDQQQFGSATIQATRLNDAGKVVCSQFPVSSYPANKGRLSADKTSSGLSAVAWEDDRIGNNAIYIQNVNRDCSLGQKLVVK